MPWTKDDVEKHHKGLSDKQKAVWVRVANQCLAAGDDDATAIKKANAAANAVKESITFDVDGEVFTATFASDGSMDLSDVLPVQRIEEAALEGDVVQFRERAVGQDGTLKVKIIAPGQGATAFYPAEVLRRDGPKVFRRGMHMYLDHQTDEEEAKRPENSVKNLAGVLESDAVWEDHPTGGPGLYAQARVYSDFREFLNERSKDIGVSIRAMGRGKHGQVSGKPTFIAEQLTSGKSVDFVTAAGAGGKLMSLYEAARNGRNPQQEQPMTEEEKQEMARLQEAAKKVPALEAENERLREALVTNAGNSVISEMLAKSDLKDKAQARVRKLVGEFPVTDKGSLDEPKLRETVKALIEEEKAYLKENAGGKIEGMGDGSPSDMTDSAKLKERQEAAYKVLTGK